MFIICDDMDHASRLLSHFNNSHLNIMFTMEYKRDNQFNFLNDGSLEKKQGQDSVELEQLQSYQLQRASNQNSSIEIGCYAQTGK